MSEFLDKFVKNNKSKADPDSKFVFEHDKWDRAVADKIYAEIQAYRVATGELKKITHTGFEAMVDNVYSLMKASPELRDPKEIRPSWLIDHKIMEVFTDMKEYEKFRPSTKGDPVNAGLAAVDLEPTLEKLFDQMEDANKTAQQIEEMLGKGEVTEEQIQQLMEAAQQADTPGESQSMQDQAAALQELLDELAKGIEQKTQDLNNLLDAQVPDIKETLEEAMQELNDKAEATSQFTSWGLNQGTLARMDPTARIELSKKLGSEKFKKMADIIGKMQTLAITAQQAKTDYSPDEIYDIEQGDDLARMLPSEALALCDEYLELDWMRRFTEKTIQQYAIRGNNTVEKGSILLLEDGSGSMTMNNGYIWAKAIALALLKIAFMQHRGFYGVQFGGPGQHVDFEFDTSTSVLELDIIHGNEKQHHSGIEALVEYADKFLNFAGTDFMTPFSVALDRLNKEYDEKGLVEADIVFLTDGLCAVSDTWMDNFKKEQERLGFRVYGIVIGGNPEDEPTRTLCDGKVISFTELTDSKTNALGPLFGAI